MATRKKKGTDKKVSSPLLTMSNEELYQRVAGKAYALYQQRDLKRAVFGKPPILTVWKEGEPQPTGTLGDLLVEVIMTRKVYTAKPTDTLLSAALCMHTAKISALPEVLYVAPAVLPTTAFVFMTCGISSIGSFAKFWHILSAYSSIFTSGDLPLDLDGLVSVES